MAKTKLVEGLYDLMVDEELHRGLSSVEELNATFGELEPAMVAALLTTQLGPRIFHALESVAKGEKGGEERQVALANRLLQVLLDTPRAGTEPHDRFASPAKRLTALQRQINDFSFGDLERPSLPLTSSELLVNGRQELRIGSELRKELASADRVDLLCAFLKQSGVNIIRTELERFLRRRPNGLRILTTTYMGATEKKAIEELVRLGAQLRISYNNQTTRLHAKAWLFHRETGFSTAFVGSSNLSAAALLDGLEWNVRVTAVDNSAIVDRFETTFEQYWNDVEFEVYDAERFKAAFREQSDEAGQEYISGLTVRPFPHQLEILEDLMSERLSGHTKNLVVAATGTGKTVTAALDFKRLWDEHGPLKLLFVAHRQEILKQSRATFRAVMGDPSFGELLVGGRRPDFGEHVFASVQSMHANALSDISADAYDVVIVDEFHHAAAPTYARLLEHLDPRFLLGLTATPERGDGQSILPWFDGRIASELRLWKALDRGLLCPFQYFGVADETDLSGVTFRRGSYDAGELESVLTGDSFRAVRITQALDRYVADPSKMRALGFCVGVRHAAQMATAFQRAGLNACAVAGDPPRTNGVVDAPFLERDDALRGLRDGKIQCVFAVDLFNEGVDVPTIDTVLFLRPTESATVFLQQLGRGLRHAKNKSHLTVLDFIGNSNQKYRFDIKYQALVGGTRKDVLRQVESGFPHLPPGCEIVLDQQSREHVLQNIRAAIGNNELRYQTNELRELGAQGEVTLQTYLTALQLSLNDVYSNAGRSWSDLRRRAGLSWPEGDAYESTLLKSMARIQHIDDQTRIQTWMRWLMEPTPPQLAEIDTIDGRLQLMLLAGVVDRKIRTDKMDEAFSQIWSNPSVRKEMLEMLAVVEDQHRNVTYADELGPKIPLRVHGTYSLAEIMAGYGVVKKDELHAPREGVFYDRESNTDLLFVTLNKSEDDYSANTLYKDYPISQDLFHWESQHTTSSSSETGQRYIHHQSKGSSVVLFVRQFKKVSGLTQPYLCLGKARYLRHQSERPMQITWALERPMPAWFYQEAKTAAG